MTHWIAVRYLLCCIIGSTALAVLAGPTVGSISPPQGPIVGGTVVTITGNGFSADSTVRFNRGSATNVIVLDASHIQATVPPLGNGPFATALAAVRVSNSSGTTYTEFLYLPPAFDQIAIGDITTIAGVGNFVGEGRLAAQALVDAQAIAFDAAGNLYMGEEPGGRVRKIGPDGRIVTIGGTGVIGFSGDGGPATDAQFNWPAGVAVDHAGNVYVADGFGNNRIRRIDVSTGVVTTIAGAGRAGYSGDGAAATQAALNMPSSLALDGQANVYVVDSGNQRIRRIDVSGVITTLAGNGSTGYSGDGGLATQASFRLAGQLGTLALDSRGTIYVVDFGNGRIRRIGSDGIVTTVVGGGSLPPSEGATATQVNDPLINSVAVDPQDRVLFTDDTHVWRLASNGVLAKLAGSGTRGLSPDGVPALNASMIPRQLAVAPNGDIFVSEASASRIRRIDAVTGALTTAAGVGPAAIGDSGASALAAVFPDIGNIGFDGAGNILVVDPRGSRRIRRIDSAGKIVTVAGMGVQPIQGFYHEGVQALSAGITPVSVQSDASGNLFYTDFCSVRRIGSDGLIHTVVGPVTNNQQCGFGGDGGPATGALLAAEQDTVKLDTRGNIFVADVFNHRVRRVDSMTGVITTFAGSGPATAPGGYDQITPGGTFAGDGGPASQALLSAPTDVAFDASGNVCIADTGNFSVRCVDAQGIIRVVAGRGNGYPGDGSLATAVRLNPYRIGFDHVGSMYISDAGDSTIRKLDVNGVISTVAGVHGNRGFSGDGGPALQANIDYGSGLAVDAQGNVLIFDGDNRRIRVIKMAATLGGSGSTPTANTPGGLSGIWWNAGESGWGVHFTQRKNIIFAAWYTYDNSGNPKWYVSTCAMPTGVTGTAGTCNGTIFEVNGPTFFGTAFNPSLVNVVNAGTLQVVFQDAGSASMSYAGVGGQTRTVAITRQPLATGTTPPTLNYTDLWWNPAESGWGIAITQQFATVFIAWYVYDDSAKPTWYVATCTLNGTSCTGDVLRTTGPRFGPAFDPTQVHVFTAGTMTVNFSDPNNGVLSYTVNGVSASKVITRELF